MSSAYDILKFYTFLPPLWAPFGLHSIHFRRMVFSAWAPQTGHHGHHFGFCRNRNLISSKEKTLGNSAFPRVFGKWLQFGYFCFFPSLFLICKQDRNTGINNLIVSALLPHFLCAIRQYFVAHTHIYLDSQHVH